MGDERAQEFGEEKVREEEEEFVQGEEMDELGEEEFTAENDVREARKYGEEEVSYSVKNVEEMILSSLSNKRIKDMWVDRLSALPDALLIHILSLLGVKRAAITSVLSKRWQFLWSELPRFAFREGSEEIVKICEFVTMVTRALVIRSEKYLGVFKVEFTYRSCFASDVNVWVEFAVKNKVKVISLLLNHWEDDLYTLPQKMYSNSYLKMLGLRRCFMDPQRSIEWRSLTWLLLENMELRQHVIENIFSGCPVLRSLQLRHCWGIKCLEAHCQSLYKLVVYDCFGEDDTLLEISAPYVHALEIWYHPIGGKLCLTGIPSDVRASIYFVDSVWYSSEAISNTKELLEGIQHVEELTMGCDFFEVLSMLALEGWQCPQSRRRFLAVYASSDEHTISGILGLLESSPNLETLIINGLNPCEESFPLAPVAKGDLDCDLMHLKTIKIRNFVNPDLVGEPLLTLARILLKRATVLEHMVVDVEKFTTSQSELASGDLSKIFKTVLSYPRSSQKAVVFLR